MKVNGITIMTPEERAATEAYIAAYDTNPDVVRAKAAREDEERVRLTAVVRNWIDAHPTLARRYDISLALDWSEIEHRLYNCYVDHSGGVRRSRTMALTGHGSMIGVIDVNSQGAWLAATKLSRRR